MQPWRCIPYCTDSFNKDLKSVFPPRETFQSFSFSKKIQASHVWIKHQCSSTYSSLNISITHTHSTFFMAFLFRTWKPLGSQQLLTSINLKWGSKIMHCSHIWESFWSAHTDILDHMPRKATWQLDINSLTNMIQLLAHMLTVFCHYHNCFCSLEHLGCFLHPRLHTNHCIICLELDPRWLVITK